MFLTNDVDNETKMIESSRCFTVRVELQRELLGSCVARLRPVTAILAFLCCVPFVSEVGSRNDVTPELNTFHLCFSGSSQKRAKMTTR